jgi:hypothetical protein
VYSNKEKRVKKFHFIEVIKSSLHLQQDSDNRDLNSYFSEEKMVFETTRLRTSAYHQKDKFISVQAFNITQIQHKNRKG